MKVLTKKSPVNEIEIITEMVVEAMKEKKAKNIVELDLSNLDNRVVDMFIICHADNDRQVEAIASNVEDSLKEKIGERVWHREGYENRQWILLDYVNVVCHIFLKDQREFYAIEELWGDAKTVHHKNID